MFPKEVDKKSKTLFYGKLEGVVHGTNMIMGPHFPLHESVILYYFQGQVFQILSRIRVGLTLIQKIGIPNYRVARAPPLKKFCVRHW